MSLSIIVDDRERAIIPILKSFVNTKSIDIKNADLDVGDVNFIINDKIISTINYVTLESFSKKLLAELLNQLLPHLSKIKKSNITIKTDRLTTGDYAIMINDKIASIIERKTIKDMSASLKDGRYNNKQKLIDLRNETGCYVDFLIESSKPFASPNTKFAGIPFKTLESAILSMRIRDDFNIIYSKDQNHTAYMIYTLAYKYLDMYIRSLNGDLCIKKDLFDRITNVELNKSKKIIKKIQNKIENKEEIVGDNENNKKDEEIGNVEKNDMIILKKTKQKSPEQIIMNIWTCVPQVSNATAGILMNNINLYDFVNCHRDIINKISKLKFSSGYSFGKKKVLKMLGYRNIKAIKDINTKNIKVKNSVCLAMLSGIDGISKNTATTILDKYSLQDISKSNVSETELADIKIKTSTGKERRLGNVKAKKIIDTFTADVLTNIQ